MDDATAGGAAVGRDGAVVAAGTATRDGGPVLVRVPASGPPQVVRAPTGLTTAAWRAVAATSDGKAVVAGSGRDASGRSLVALQRFGPRGAEGPPQTFPLGEGDAYARDLRVDRENTVVVGADGVEDDHPAAFSVTLVTGERPAVRRRDSAPGRLAGVAADGAFLVTRWDGERQSVAFDR